MTPKPQQLKSLATLVSLRERDVDRLLADMAEKQKLRARYQNNIARMDHLCSGGTAPHALASAVAMPSETALALSENLAHYKQAVLKVAATHRTDLALHEADMAVTQRALAAAAHKHEAFGQVLAQRQRVALGALRVREQKFQDDIATQRWARKTAP